MVGCPIRGSATRTVQYDMAMVVLPDRLGEVEEALRGLLGLSRVDEEREAGALPQPAARAELTALAAIMMTTSGVSPAVMPATTRSSLPQKPSSGGRPSIEKELAARTNAMVHKKQNRAIKKKTLVK